GLGARAALLEAIDQIMSVSASHFRAAEIGQLTLFAGSAGAPDTIRLPASADLPRRQQLAWERELLGVYASDHPLTPHLERLNQVVTHFSAELGEAGAGQTVCVGGEVSHVRPYLTRSGKNMAFVTLEDLQGTVELVVFARVWDKAEPWLKPEEIVVATGKVDAERGDPKVLVQEIRPIDSLPAMPVRANEAGETGPAGVGPPAMQAPEEPMPVPDPVPAGVVQAGSEDVAPSSVPSRPDREVDRPPARRPDLSGKRLVTVILRSTGDKLRDARRMRRVHGLLNSYPGTDQFVFDVYESSRRYSLEFPNSSTGFCAELRIQLEGLLGAGSIHVSAPHPA
ncbi:MAG: OB-fold nucleic acid binding domain-containing protein, partial [Anaerolineales bacterium]